LLTIINAMRLLSSFIILSLLSLTARAQLVLNEVSQGASGTKEYMEFVVTGTRTCTDSTADLRGWIIDDNNGWIASGSGTGIAQGCMRFANVANWSKVPYGSIILVYNDGDKNGSITMADDVTDANKDYVYIVPASSVMMERHTSLPVSPSSSTFVYPSSGFISGGSWSPMGLSNTGDGVVIASPSDLTRAYFSLGFGIGSAATATVYKATLAAQRNYYLSDANYASATAWLQGTVPGNESPGAPNGGANTAWINSMRTTPPGSGPITNMNACIKAGDSYNFNGNILTTTGNYSAVIPRPGQCDSTVKLYLVVGTDRNETLSGCGSVVLNGITYTSNTLVKDTIRSVVTSCDSIFRNIQVQIQTGPVSLNTACIKSGDSYTFNGNTYTAGGNYSATIPRPGQCDSTARLYLVVATTNTRIVTDCGRVIYNGTTYTANSVVRDTVRSVVSGCDSVLNVVNIDIKPKPAISINPVAAVCKGKTAQLQAQATSGSSVEWLGIGTANPVQVAPQTNTTYTAVATAANGCTDTARVNVVVTDFSLDLTTAVNPVQAGVPVTVTTQSTSSYSITEWQPSRLYPQQTALSQQFRSDTSTNIMVVGRTPEGCIDTARLFLQVDPINNDLFVPNVFSPNGDGRNDVFRVFGSGLNSIDLSVFNQWGELIFRSRDINTGWDGRYKGTAQPVGVYIYVLRAELTDGNIINKKGSVNLIR
jgi:gliding motility-associated-like protein